jgi:hypothetical protein
MSKNPDHAEEDYDAPTNSGTWNYSLRGCDLPVDAVLAALALSRASQSTVRSAHIGIASQTITLSNP